MKQRRERLTDSRRDFLRQGVVTTGGVLMTALVGDSIAEPATLPYRGSAAAVPTGYRETAHVRRYYETARG